MSIGRIATAAIAAALLAGSGWGMAIWTPKAICEASGMYGGDNNRYSKAADPFDTGHKERSIMIGRLWWSAYLIAVLVGSPTDGWAQNFGDGAPMRVKWEADRARNGLQAVCGRVFNDRPVTALRVRLWVEGLDASGHVMNSRDAEVRGEVPSNPRRRSSRRGHDRWASFNAQVRPGASGLP